MKSLLDWFETRIEPYPEDDPAPPPRGFFAFFWFCAAGLKRHLVALVLLTAAIGAFEALLFSMLGHMLDWLAHTAPAELFQKERTRLIELGVILLLSPILVGLQSMVKHQTLAANFPMRLRWNFHRLLLAQSMSFYQDEFAGRVAAKVMQTALAVRDTWITIADILVFVGIYFITVALVAGSFDAWLALPFVLWLVAYLVALYYFVPRLSRLARAQADARSLMTGRITDAYTNISTVKLFSHNRREARFARAAMQEFMVTAKGQMRYVTGFEITNHALAVLLIATTATLALWLWTRNVVGVGAVAAASAMALRLNGISQWVMWEMTALFEAVGTVQDGINTIARMHSVTDAAAASPLSVKAGAIQFEGVSFTYPGSGQPVIENLSLNIRAGERVGLVGRSGAGKSTVVNLLLRFYDVDQGRILIDGQDIALATQDSLRAQIGMVTQDTSLLHRSVRDNIAYGKPSADAAEIDAAAAAAKADAFIATLADARGHYGYDALVGERGVKLSGGQRQRIAIARVMLKDAPILVLDEATSALDSEVEAAIQDSLGQLMQGKTVLAIAHRLSTIAAMDRLIVLDQGRVVEEGDHHSLLARNGLYARLWAHQSGGFLVEDDAQDGCVARATLSD